MAQVHVLMLLFAPVPARKAGIHKQPAVESIGNQVIKLFQSLRWMRRKIYPRLLPVQMQLKLLIGVFHQQMRQQMAPKGFTSGRLPHSSGDSEMSRLK